MLQDRIVFQEVPNEVSLLFQITGCRLRCKGCHSPELWNRNHGIELTNKYFLKRLTAYKGLITCALFFGGEWHKDELIEKFIIAKQNNIKTCLYTGENEVSGDVLEHLDYVKVGKWNAEYGGLNDPNTNQLFLNLNTGEKLNFLFHSKKTDTKTKNNERVAIYA